MRETTLCYLEKDHKYLMLHRTKKDQSKGKWLGVGGKFEKGETKEQCMLREVLEETGFTLKAYEYRAKIYFYSDIYEDEIMYLYTSSEFTGTMIECNEGELAWIDKEEVLNLNMWEGDKIFLEKLLRDEPGYFELELYYEGETLMRCRETGDLVEMGDSRKNKL